MREMTITVTNRLGLHARAAAKLVQVVQPFDAEITLVHGDKQINAKSIMGVMLLAAGKGSQLTLMTDGPDAESAAAAVSALFARNFDEQD